MPDMHWREVGEYIALAGGWAAILGRAHHVYDAVVKEGGVRNIWRAFWFGSARWAEETKKLEVQNEAGGGGK